MTRPIEAVLSEAQQRLESTGRLNIAAFVSAYPEHADELKELLPVMLNLHQEKRWQMAAAASRAFAVGLFAELTAQTAPGEATVGDLFQRERQEAGLSLEEQSRRSGLPIQALEQITRDDTPVSRLDNAGIKQLAARVAAPFASLAKEIRRLVSLESISPMNPGAVFTRDQNTSTADEQKALLEKVREAARKPAEKPPEKPPEGN